MTEAGPAEPAAAPSRRRRRRAPLNPVFAREIQERMRGMRAMLIITIFLAILAAIVIVVYQSKTRDEINPFGAPLVTQLASLGQSIFEWVLFFMMLLVLFLVPGFTSGAIAGERERQTLLPMQVSLLRPSSILVGKLWASVVFTVLLVLAAVPMLTVGYLIGGVTVKDIFATLGFVLLTAIAVAAITIACSTFFKRVQTATVWSYGIVLLLVGGTIALFVMAREVDESRGFDVADPPEWIVAPNPLAALADLSGERPNQNQFGFEGDVVFGPFGPVNAGSNGSPLSGIRDLITPDVVFFEEPPIRGFDDNGNPIFDDPSSPGDGLDLWAKSAITLSGVAVVALGASVLRLRTPAGRER